MKKKIVYGVVALSLIGSMAIPYGCKKISPDNYTISVNTDVFSAPTAILFENANSTSDKQPGDFPITISGKDADKVITSLGKSTYGVTNGFTFLSLKKGVEPTRENPITFKVSGKPDGFESFVYDVVITENAEQNFSFKLIEEGAALPSGMVELKQNETLTNGKPSNPIVIETTTTNSGTEQSAKMDMAAGTVIFGLDKKTPLTGSDLAINVRYFDPRTEANDVVPGGLNPQDVVDKNNNKIEGGANFISAGVIKVDMTVNGTKVGGFDKEVAAQIELASGQDNPETGEPLKVGDKMPLWSRNDETGQWSAEDSAIVAQNGNKLVAKFKMIHLSSYGLMYRPKNRIFTFKFEQTGFVSSGTTGSIFDELFTGQLVYITAYSKEGTIIIPKRPIYVSGLENNYYFIMPMLDVAYFKFTDANTGKVVQTANINTKNQALYSFNLSQFDDPNVINLALDYTIKCTANKMIPSAGTYAIITNLNTKQKITVRIDAPSKTKKGGMKIKLVNKNYYRIETLGLDGKIISYESILDINNLITKNVNGFTINKLIYNQSTKKVEAAVTYVTTKC